MWTLDSKDGVGALGSPYTGYARAAVTGACHCCSSQPCIRHWQPLTAHSWFNVARTSFASFGVKSWQISVSALSRKSLWQKKVRDTTDRRRPPYRDLFTCHSTHKFTQYTTATCLTSILQYYQFW